MKALNGFGWTGRSALISMLILAACSHNPNKAEKIDTQISKSAPVSGDESVGVKDGNMVVQKKVLMSEELRKLQYDVFELEDHVYGNRKFGSLGVYGVLQNCRADLSDRRNGGDGKLIWTEPIDRVTDKDDGFKLGVDEKDKIVGVSEEFLKDRLDRFSNYQKILRKRQDDLEEKLRICQAELKSRKFDQAAKLDTDP